MAPSDCSRGRRRPGPPPDRARRRALTAAAAAARRRCDVISLLSIRRAPGGGGASRVCSAVRVYNQMLGACVAFVRPASPIRAAAQVPDAGARRRLSVPKSQGVVVPAYEEYEHSLEPSSERGAGGGRQARRAAGRIWRRLRQQLDVCPGAYSSAVTARDTAYSTAGRQVDS